MSSEQGQDTDQTDATAQKVGKIFFGLDGRTPQEIVVGFRALRNLLKKNGRTFQQSFLTSRVEGGINMLRELRESAEEQERVLMEYEKRINEIQQRIASIQSDINSGYQAYLLSKYQAYEAEKAYSVATGGVTPCFVPPWQKPDWQVLQPVIAVPDGVYVYKKPGDTPYYKQAQMLLEKMDSANDETSLGALNELISLLGRYKKKLADVFQLNPQPLLSAPPDVDAQIVLVSNRVNILSVTLAQRGEVLEQLTKELITCEKDKAAFDASRKGAMIEYEDWTALCNELGLATQKNTVNPTAVRAAAPPPLSGLWPQPAPTPARPTNTAWPASSQTQGPIIYTSARRTAGRVEKGRGCLFKIVAGIVACGVAYYYIHSSPPESPPPGKKQEQTQKKVEGGASGTAGADEKTKSQCQLRPLYVTAETATIWKNISAEGAGVEQLGVLRKGDTVYDCRDDRSPYALDNKYSWHKVLVNNKFVGFVRTNQLAVRDKKSELTSPWRTTLATKIFIHQPRLT